MVDFLGIGAQKSGTTWLYQNLGSHPQIIFPGGKEIHFWDNIDGSRAGEWLRILDPDPTHSPQGLPIRSGEITPSYALLDAATIQVVRGVAPGLRLFMSLRNPMDRAWSAARMGLQRCQMEMHEASDQWLIDHFHSRASRQRGDYLGCLQRWLSVFPREQMFVMLLDQIAADPVGLLHKLALHLQVDPAGFDQVSLADFGRVVVPLIEANPIQPALEDPGQRPVVLEALHDLYDPQILELEQFLGFNLDAWKQTTIALPVPGGQPVVSVAVAGAGFARVEQLKSQISASVPSV